VFQEPAAADPDDIASKQAAAPALELPPPECVLGPDGRVVDYTMQGITFWRKARNRISLQYSAKQRLLFS
jgi:hypothetical protein